MRKIKHIAIVPTLLTLGNLLCGVVAIQKAFTAVSTTGQLDLDKLVTAATLCFAAMVFDMLDGTVARVTRSTSRFGGELDSLADLVSFGVAPAVIVMVLLRNFGGMDKYTAVFLAAYVAFGALRLARYNVEDMSGEKPFPLKKAPPPMHFSGLPIPAACGAVVSTIIMTAFAAREGGWIDTHWPWFLAMIIMALPFFMLMIGLLMVSRVPYAHLTKMFLTGKRPFAYFSAVLVTIILVVLHPEPTLFAGFQAYVIYGLLRAALMYFLKRRQIPEEEPSAQLEG